MRITAALAVMLAAACPAVASEIQSPFEPNFFTIPGRPHWLPDSVSAAMTPGADSSFYVTVTTNRVASAWELEDDSKIYWNTGSGAYIGIPQWVDDHWSDARAVLDFDTQPFDISDFPGCHLDLYGWEQSGASEDEWTTYLNYFVNSEVVEDESGGHIVASDYVTANFTRTVSDIVTAVTNLPSLRFTTDLQSSVFHTLDGWLERDFFTSHTIGEPTHDLKAISLAPYGTNRTVNSRRITGKTNLWHVASALLDRSHGWFTGLGVDTYFSSTAFDSVYGPQLPDNISWTSAGLYSLSNKCAVLYGVREQSPWGGNHYRGWPLLSLFPERFLFYDIHWQIVYTYDMPQETPGHAFSFRELCETNDYQYCLVDSVTNRTRRLELETQAGINQTLSMLDRTVVSDSATTVTGKSCEVTYVRKYLWSGSYESAGLVLAPGGYWEADSDLMLRPAETTNYVNIATNDWTFSWPEDVSDAVEVGENEPFISVRTTADPGHWTIEGKEITDWLNGIRAVGTPGVDYIVDVQRVDDFGDSIRAVVRALTPQIEIADFSFPRAPTNSRISVSMHAYNSADVNKADVPDFARLRILPMNQAWDAGSHERVKSCKDICTASVGIFDYAEGDDPMQELEMHCSVLNRAYGDSVQDIHAAEWRRHRQKIEQDVERRRDNAISSPGDYVRFSESDVSDVLDSIKIPRASYGLYWPSSFGGLVFVRVNAQGVWDLAPDSPVAITLQPNCSLDIAYDTTLHEIEVKPALKEYCRQRITNVIDWYWNAIRK